MLPASGDKLHVRSSRVVLDGALAPARVELALAPDGPVVVSIERDDGSGDALDLGACVVAPAPLDLHFHGAGGHVVPPAGEVGAIDAVLRAAAELAAWRSTSMPAPRYEWVATLPVPGVAVHDDPLEVAVREVEGAAAAVRRAREGGPCGCVGLRIEGLFLNPSRAGVWPPGSFIAPDVQALERLHAAAAPHDVALLVVDVAPEVADPASAQAFVERAAQLGVVVSLAHTEATLAQATAAFDAGVRLATHTWNAMRPVAHREPGVVVAALLDERVACELICDGEHLHDATVALSVRASGDGRWLAVSDASPFAGCPPGEYEWAGTRLRHDGSALRDPSGRLAGSASLLWQAQAQLARAGIDPLAAVLAVGAVPRRVLDPARSLGLHPGDPAWFVRLDDAAPARPAHAG